MKQSVMTALCVVLLFAGTVARAGDKHLVELFTSQGCYSCPPADRLLGELIETRNDIVALSFHVDYWDDLVYGAAGRWPDPFSDSAYTQRQRRYQSRGLEGNNGVYTPQVVIDGRTAAVGSNQTAIEKLLADTTPGTADIALRRESDSLQVMVSGDPVGAAEVWLYQFDRRNVTRIEGGENNGKTLANHHVVRNARQLGDWNGETREYVASQISLNEESGCAVVVQRAEQSDVLGVELCRP